tara:strand:+ start:1218 stop:2315 length:1098 start_codon:yes stop_codon:yes gene_type:complete
MKKNLFLLIVLGLFACSLDSEDDDLDNNNPCPSEPQLITYEESNINYDQNTDLVGVTFTAEIQNIQLGENCETFSITNQGFVYGTNIQPTTSDSVLNVNGQNVTVTVNNLLTETTYYVRAYLTNSLGTFYGNEISFTTPAGIPVYLAENGVTIIARDWAVVGDSGVIDGINYTIVDREKLEVMVANNEDVTKICTSKIIDMQAMFNPYAYSTENSELFNIVADFNQLIDNWDVSNVTDMTYMFKSTEFNQDIGSWDVSNVTNMIGMFYKNHSFDQDIGSWNVGNVTNMYLMFSDADSTSFNQDISSWDVSSVSNMTYMFYGAELFNQDLSSWDVSNVTNCQQYCEGATSWKLPKPIFTKCNSGCD